jgi:membrane associated rhomboid family serine protease
MIPLGDRLRRRRAPLVTSGLALALAAAFVALALLPLPEATDLVLRLALVPARLAPLLAGELAAASELPRLWSSLAIHAGVVHLAGNLLFLWVFGRGVENALGPRRLLGLFLLCGALAGLVHTLADPRSEVPTVGASGAISGVMGAYLALFPRARVRSVALLVVWPVRVEVPALVWLGLWLALQLASGFLALSAATQSGGVAWWAHVGGFAAGLALARPLRRR